LKRRERLRLTPSILAYLPPQDDNDALRGWALCKRVEGTGVINGWQILVDPTQYEYLAPGTRVLVDRREVIGCKVRGIVRDVGRQLNDELIFTVECLDDDEGHYDLREGLFRNDLISVDAKIFYWHADRCEASWDCPDHLDADTKEALRRQLDFVSDDNITAPRLALTAETILAAAAASHKRETSVTFTEEFFPQREEEALSPPKTGLSTTTTNFSQATSSPRSDTEASRRPKTSASRATSAASEKASVDAIRDFDVFFRPRDRDLGAANAPWPILTGPEWDDLAANHARLLRYLGDWEEYEHVRTLSRFWRDTFVAEQEAAVRRFQRLYRQRFFRSAPRFWFSQAYFWTKPAAVASLERDRNGWALLRRRAQLMRSCRDLQGRTWEEYLDSISGELFYYLSFSGYCQWERPQLADHDGGTQDGLLDILDQGDEVIFRFQGDADDSLCVVANVKIDAETQERTYDIAATTTTTTKRQSEVNERAHQAEELVSSQLAAVSTAFDRSTMVKGVPRHRLRRKHLTHLEVEQYREERQWRLMLRRAKDADDRVKKKHDDKLQETLFHSKHPSKKNRAEDIARARSLRASAEAELMEAEAKAAADKERKATVMALANDQGIDMRALMAQQTGVSILRVKEDDMALAKLAGDVKETRARLKKERQDRERAIVERKQEEEARLAWLATMEDKTTSPRSKARRRVLRLLYRAQQRQHAGYVICEWGCGEWIKIGRQKLFHEKESCVMRVLPCALGCDRKLREEQWVGLVNSAGVAEKESDHHHQEEEQQKNDARQRMTMTYRQWHERQDCGRRLVPCARRCGEWVPADDVEHHLEHECIKRPLPELACRLGCDAIFKGSVMEMLQCEARRIEHEQEMCDERMVPCQFKDCATAMKARDRKAHRQLHILRANVALYEVPGVYSYKVPPSTRQLKVQLWGAGGGSGHLRDHCAGSGGGGAFVEALVLVIPGEVLQITVGAGGGPGVCGSFVEQPLSSDRDKDQEMVEVCGVAMGGEPGGGNGHGGNEAWCAGGGGGYSMLMRFTKQGSEVVCVAAGGGGAGSRDGGPGGGLDGEMPGDRVDKRNGRMGTQENGGKAGDSGEKNLCTFPSEDGRPWQGGAGSQFGGGGGGGLFGGGGGGTSPGIAGGGGGGSSYVQVGSVKDFKVLQGKGTQPGGSSKKHKPPRACGIGSWDFTGGVAGAGANGSVDCVYAGRHGAVRITRPGFYDEDPTPLQPLGDEEEEENAPQPAAASG